MNPGFSGVLRITDLNDFIHPSQECVKPLIAAERTITSQIAEGVPKAKVSLNDCLACSGCITSAESVLIDQQSVSELRKRVDQIRASVSSLPTTVVATVAPQVIASFAAKFGVSYATAVNGITALLGRLGVNHCLDAAFARHFSLLETAKEVEERYKAGHNLPVLSSICPGFICYAEKTHGELLIPHISRVRSPQQILGAYVKTHLASKLGMLPQQTYHVSVMPCFDKKLESFRSDFVTDEMPQVDCVITPVELEEFLTKESVDFSQLCTENISDNLDDSFSLRPDQLLRQEGSGSGGYAEFVFRYIASRLLGQTIQVVPWQQTKNKDFMEAALIDDAGATKFKVAICNGFRNIQAIVQRLKRSKCDYHFVEIMACPSGCVNGGAQLRPVEGVTPVLHIETVAQLYKSIPSVVDPQEDSRVGDLYTEWFGDTKESIERCLFTQYKPVPKNVNPLMINW